MAGQITREQKVAYSVASFVQALVEGAYDVPDQVELHDSFPYEDIKGGEAIDKQHVAFGFQFDDGGRPGELGSNLTRRLHTFEVYVFATTGTWAENIATRAAQAIDGAKILPLIDPEADDAQIDTLVLEQVICARQPVRNPRPWEKHVWLTTAKVWDEFYPQP